MADLIELSKLLSEDSSLRETVAKAKEDPVFFCKTCLINPDTGGPFIPNYIQEKFMSDESQIKYVWVHRRGGKSFGIIAMMLWYACFSNKQIHYFAQSSTIVDEIFRILDKIISESPFLKFFISSSGNLKQPIQTRCFQTGAQIFGHCMTVNEGQMNAKRGLTPDVTIIDEAQSIGDEGFTVMNAFFLAADATRFHTVKAIICGTVKDPKGEFYKKACLRQGISAPRMSVLKVSINDNPYISEEMRNEYFKAEAGNLDRWNTEYALNIRTSSSDAAFNKVMIEQAFQEDYDLGLSYELINDPTISANCVNIVTADWDKRQAGSNIVVWNYNRITKMVRMVDRWETQANGEFSYTEACQKLIEFYSYYNCKHIVVDAGNGDSNIEIILTNAKDCGLYEEIKRVLIRMPFQKTIQVLDPVKEEIIKQPAKQWLYKLAVNKLEMDHIRMPKSDQVCYQQFLSYAITGITGKGALQFSKKNEHIIDCLFFGLYAVWYFYDDLFSELRVLDEDIWFEIDTLNVKSIAEYQEQLAAPKKTKNPSVSMDSTFFRDMDDALKNPYDIKTGFENGGWVTSFL